MRAYREYDGGWEWGGGGQRSASRDEILEFINKFHSDLSELRYHFVSRKLTTQYGDVSCPTTGRFA